LVPATLKSRARVEAMHAWIAQACLKRHKSCPPALLDNRMWAALWRSRFLHTLPRSHAALRSCTTPSSAHADPVSPVTRLSSLVAPSPQTSAACPAAPGQAAAVSTSALAAKYHVCGTLASIPHTALADKLVVQTGGAQQSSYEVQQPHGWLDVETSSKPMSMCLTPNQACRTLHRLAHK